MSQIGSYDNLPERKCGYAGYAQEHSNVILNMSRPMAEKWITSIESG